MKNFDTIGQDCKNKRNDIGATQIDIAKLLRCGDKKVRRFEQGKVTDPLFYHEYLNALGDFVSTNQKQKYKNNDNTYNEKLKNVEAKLKKIKLELCNLLPHDYHIDFINNTFIAGGCIYSLYNSQEVKDYDFFVSDEQFAKQLRLYIVAIITANKTLVLSNGIHKGIYREQNVVVTDNAITIGKFQIITKWIGDPVDVVSQFDFKHLMFYFDDKIHTLSDFKYLDDNRLRYNENRARDVVGTVMRATKFVERGMVIYPEEWAKILLKLKDIGFSDNEVDLLERQLEREDKRVNDDECEDDDEGYGYVSVSNNEGCSSSSTTCDTY